MALVSLILLASYLSITRSFGDLVYKENTIESLRRAARLDPSNAVIHNSLGVQLELAGGGAAAEFQAAARLDPPFAEPWLRLGLLAEARGDLDTAERSLLHAAEIDHRLAPRFTLMNFYVRRAQTAAFWHWARLAFERAYGDSTPLFDLCWQVAGDPAEVYDKAIPRTHDIERSYLAYLLSHGRLPAARQPARDLLTHSQADDRALFLDYCDRLIDTAPAEALWIWNESCRRGLLPYQALHPEQLPPAINPAFTQEPLQRGFDWRLMEVSAVSSARLPGGGIQFALSGRQAEALELIAQTLPVLPHRGYRVVIDYQTEAIAASTGLTLAAEDRTGGRPLGAVSLVGAEDGSRQSFGLKSSASGLVTLRLRYRRPSGSVRAEGKLIVRSIRLENAQ